VSQVAICPKTIAIREGAPIRAVLYAGMESVVEYAALADRAGGAV